MTPPNVVNILLVEDNPRDAELTIRALRKRNLANNLIAVEDGVEALDFVFGRGKYADRSTINQPKVILLDIKLPKMNGLEVLQAIKSNAQTQHIPVVMVTSSREDPDMKTAYRLGANSYVVKPVGFENFLEAMSHIGLYWLLVNELPN
ncbi:MAG: response regulator [Anaerolineales bacterium]|nr:response regulator [Anaerolineales bacterium]MCB0019964.1 response regulator [Anaerolineales bacterium]MCB0026682.1 response regulator [Anaerolineales bacterium]MCB8962583.1 response regulator [Ardenticatenales bacterium]